MRIGIICEGGTDDAVLRAILRETCAPGDLVFSSLQPKVDEIGHIGLGGWQAVRKFLQQSSAMIIAAQLDMIIVQVDADVRRLPEITKHLDAEDGDEELDPLCRHIKGWMSAGVPESVIIVLPRESTEAWLIAASTNLKKIETIEGPARVLADMGLIAGSKGKGAKNPAAFGDLVARLLPSLKKPAKLAAVPELERFVSKIRHRISRLKGATLAAKKSRA
jgi:hypothetical protein